MNKTGSRILALTLALVLAAALLSGCGGSSGPEGVYKLKSMEADGVTMEYDTMKGVLAANGLDPDDLFLLELTADGKAIMRVQGNEVECSYTVDGNHITMPFQETVIAEWNGRTIAIEYNGAKIVFEKK